MLSDFEKLLKIVKDCEDQEAIVQIALNLILSCHDVYDQYIDSSTALSLLSKLLCERYLYMWRLHAVLIRLCQMSSFVSFPNANDIYKSILLAFESGTLSKSLEQICLWTLSCLCKDRDFHEGKTL